MRCWALLPLALLVSQAVSAAQLHFIDSTKHSFLRQDGDTRALSAAGTTALMASLLGTQTPQNIQSTVSKQVDAILAPNVFKRPKAVLAVALAGVSEGDLAAVGGVFKDAIAIAFDGEGTSAAQELLSAFDDVTDYINNDVLVKPLDSTSLPSYCGEECLEKSVWFLAELSGFNYTQRKQPSADCGPDAWCAHITAGGNTEVQLLDMMKLPDRLAALELAQLSSIVHDMLARNDPKEMKAPKPLLLEAHLIGAQLLRDTYGAQSVQHTTALQIAASLLAELSLRLGDALDNSVVVQVAALGPVQLDKGTGIKELMQWRSQHRSKMQRRSLLATSPASKSISVGRLSLTWATHSLAYLVALIILLGILAATSCIARMDFGQDTLLFARPKTD